MIPKGLFTHILLLIVSIAIVITYIKPALEATSATQDDISVYKEQQQNVSTVNEKLNRLKTSIDRMSDTDTRRLLTYMPNQVDTVAVPRDIKFITDDAGVIVKQIKYDGAVEPEVGADINPAIVNIPQAHMFSVDFEGSYGQIKDILRALEQNEYPLEVHSLRVEKKEGGFLTVSMTLHTYNRQLPVLEPSIE